ncbi:hypothetical protein ACFL3B_00490 [Gemmatimonadota bacterium]
MRAAVPLVTVSMLLTVGSIDAQQPPAIPPGQRVRITAPECGIQRQVTTLEEYTGGALVMPTGSCPLDSVTRLEVSRGRKSHSLEGLGLGWLVGAGVGAAVSDCDPSSLGICEAVPIGIGATVGLVIGTIFGSLIKSDRWEEVPLDRVRVSFAPQRDGRFAVGMRVAF